MVIVHKWKITGEIDNSPEMWQRVNDYEQMLWWWNKIRGLTWQGCQKH